MKKTFILTCILVFLFSAFCGYHVAGCKQENNVQNTETETVTSEAVFSEAVLPEAVTSEEVAPEEVVSEAVLPEAVTSEKVAPEEAVSETVTPEAVTSEEVVYEAVTSEAVTPEEVVYEGTYILIDTTTKKLTYYGNNQVVKEYPIAVGAPATPTPKGEFAIINKAIQPAWRRLDGSGIVPGGDPQNPLGPRWMGFHGGCGIHGTIWPWSIGTEASHGCVRMYNENVIELYDMVQVNTKVIVK